MQITLWFSAGFHLEGFVVAGSNTELRVAIRDWNDIAVFRSEGGDWIAENGDRVVIHPHASNSPGERQFLETFVIQPARRASDVAELLVGCVPACRN